MFDVRRRRNPRLNMSVVGPQQLQAGIPVDSGDVFLTGAVFGVVGLWLVLWERLNAFKIVPSIVTRKVIHISCGSGFALLWPFFSEEPSARFLASSIPVVFIALLLASGSANENQTSRGALGRAISRQGSAREALEGPMYYSVMLLVLTVFFFKTPAAVVAIMQMCFGDGAAEVFGRRYGSSSQWGLPWTGNKSVAGSVAFAMSAFAASCGGLWWLAYMNVSSFWDGSVGTLAAVAGISVLCAAVELAPKEVIGDDNVAVIAAALAACLLFFGKRAF